MFKYMKILLFFSLVLIFEATGHGRGMLEPWYTDVYWIWDSNKTIAFKAIARNDWPTFYRMLIENKTDINAVDKYKKSLLSRAAGYERPEMFRFLLERGANPDSALLDAVERENMDMVKSLLRAGANPNLPEQNVYTGLTRAIRNENLPIVELLLRSGADPNHIQSWDGDTPLHYAARSDSPEMIRLLLQHKAKVNVLNKKGCSALAEAVRGGNFRCSAITKSKLLLEAGADVNLYETKPFSKPEYPLYIAAETGNTELAELLIKYGADVNKKIFYHLPGSLYIKGKNGTLKPEPLLRTALSTALDVKSLPMIKLLLRHGAEADPELSEEIKELEKNEPPPETDLFAILDKGARDRYEKIKQAIANGADINAMEGSSNTLLEELSYREGYIDLLELLLKHGAKRKDTALRKAIRNGNVDSVKLLLEKGADPNAICGSAYDPKPIFHLNGPNATDILPMLLEAGADINYKNYRGRNILGTISFAPRDISLLRALIKAGADWRNVDKSGKSVLELIIGDNRCPGLVRVLIDQGAKPEDVRKLAQKYKRKNLLFLLDKVWTKNSNE